MPMHDTSHDMHMHKAAGHGAASAAGQGRVEDDDLNAQPLPPLREELSITEAAEDAGWAGGWLIHDPLRNRYFRISRQSMRALACWQAGTIGGVRACLHQRYGIEATEQDIADLLTFLQRNHLLQAAAPGHWQGLWQQVLAMRQKPWKWLLHHYLFFRIPLVRPQRFLDATFPYVRWLGSRAGLLVLFVIFIIGAWLTLKQFDEFKATFMAFVNMEGLLLFGLTIIITKVAHELGHAYIATRYGARVPHMGVAFMVMFPMLYTDVTDAWKLKNRRARLLIGAGGMLTELALAGIALFLWAVLPEGPGRTAAFFVATTSLLTTLLVNLSPFMRFDGYHILADLLRMHNLQPRAFALALWWLKRLLFAIDEPPPEEYPPRLHRGLILYAFATWTYRFFLFAGIAVLVYYAFPKVLGIFLAAVEVWWFILRPVVNVLKDWWKDREEIMTEGTPKRLLITGVILLALLFAPIWRSVSLPAVLLPAVEQEVFPPEPARLVRLHVMPGQLVRKGQLLAELDSEDLRHEQRTTRARLKLVEQKLARMVASREDLRLIDVLKRERQQLMTKLAGLAGRAQRLQLRATTRGRVRTMLPGLTAGLWVGPQTMLLRVVAEDAPTVAALAPETVVGRLQPGAQGVFIADDPGARKLRVQLEEIGTARRQGRDILYLSSVHGGPVAAERDPETGEIHTRTGMFPLRLSPVPEQDRQDTTSTANARKAAGLIPTAHAATPNHLAATSVIPGLAPGEHRASTPTPAQAATPPSSPTTPPAGSRGTEARPHPAGTPAPQAMPCTTACRGRIVIAASPESIAGRLTRRLLSIILRESGF